jgi:hypothetical protein
MAVLIPPIQDRIIMLPKKFDMTFALKAISLSREVTGTDKRISAALLDHFNRKTGRCDPSYDTLAKLLGINRRTVGRGIKKAVKAKLFTMITHGGINNCNAYQPSWIYYRELDERWKLERRKHADRFSPQKMSSLPGQTCSLPKGETDLQTCSTKFIPLTSSPTKLTKQAADPFRDSVLPYDGSEQRDGLGIYAARIEKRLGKDKYHAWFRNVYFVGAAGRVIVLSVDNEQTKSRIEQWYGPDILGCFKPEYEDIVRIELVVRHVSDGARPP